MGEWVNEPVPGIRSDRVLRDEDAVKALFLDPVLEVAASAVDLLIDDAPCLRQIRHHDAGIVTRRAVTESNHLGLHTTPLLPLRLRSVC